VNFLNNLRTRTWLLGAFASTALITLMIGLLGLKFHQPAAVPDNHFTGIATVMQGELQRMLVIVNIEQFMSSAEIGQVHAAAKAH